MRVFALLVAAGRGTRLGGPEPKQFLSVGGVPVLRRAAEALLRGGLIEVIQPVCAPGEETRVAALLDGLPVRPAVQGGASRQASVRAGLEAMAADPPDFVLIHDAARPVVPPGTVVALIEALSRRAGALPALPVSDTLRRGNPDSDGTPTAGGVVPREELFRAQTPQAFRYAAILRAHREAAGGPDATDDVALLERAGTEVAMVPGSESNVKITHPGDLERVEAALRSAMLPRVGTGYDVHRLVPDRKLFLCGIEVPHELGLDGHSDADVGIHALCDAIYGALAEGDIGRWFPPSEAEWKDADSARFLRHAAGRVAERGGIIANVDVTLICERPKITPHATAMMERLASLMSVPVDRVSVKATTSERLGFTGRGEGIAAQAAVSVLVPL